MYENLLIWLGFVGVLFVAENTAMEEVFKPFVHSIIDSFPGLKTREAIIKPFAIRASALLVAYMLAYPMHEVLNVATTVAGIYLHPALGILPAVFLSVFVGRQVHDWFSARENETAAPTHS